MPAGDQLRALDQIALHGAPRDGMRAQDTILEAIPALADALDALAYVEWCWDGAENVCPSCGMAEARGHDSSCRTAKALAAVSERIGGST